MKYAVQGVILNDKGEVLAVSRKDDHNDFGLVGGKVDPEDLNPEEAMARETFEETGLRINTATMQVVFQMHRDDYMGITYLINMWSGEIHTDEPHVVKWTSFDEIMMGTFGYWNNKVRESLDSMGIEFKMKPEPKDEYYFEIFESEYDEDPPQFYIESKTYWDKHRDSRFELDKHENYDIECIMLNNKIGLPQASEGVYELHAKVDGKYTCIFDKEEVERIMLESGFKKDTNFSIYINEL